MDWLFDGLPLGLVTEYLQQDVGGTVGQPFPMLGTRGCCPHPHQGAPLASIDSVLIPVVFAHAIRLHQMDAAIRGFVAYKSIVKS